MDNTNEDRHKQYLICFQHPARKFVAWIKKQLSNKIKNYSVRKMCEVIPTMKIQKNNLIFLVHVQLGWLMLSTTHSLLHQMISKSFWLLLSFLLPKSVP